MKILIFASIGDKNLGDELILKNEIQLLEKKFSNKSLEFFVATYDTCNIFYHRENISYFSYFPNGIKQIQNLGRNIKALFQNIFYVMNSDMVVIGGGGIFYDSERQSNTGPLKQWLWRVRLAKFFRKKIYFFAPSIDIKNRENDKIIKKIFSGVYKITLRDTKSIEYLNSLGIKAIKVHDPVWHDNNNVFPENKPKLLKAFHRGEFTLNELDGIDFDNKKIGIALRQGYLSKNPEIEKTIIKEMLDYIESKGGKIILLPHSFHRDESINDKVFLQEFITPERKLLTTMQGVYEVYKLRKVDIVFGQRLHSIILSGVYGIDIVAFSYAQKTDEVLREYFNYNKL